MKRIADCFAFAREGRVLEGTLPVSSLKRLHDLLAEVSGEILFRLQGATGARGEAMLHLHVTGTLLLSCQRCLEAVRFDLDIVSHLELVPGDSELSQDELEDDTRDFLPVAGGIELAELVEDEVLLALPVAPRHERCGLPGAAGVGERNTPFAVLAGLRGRAN